MDGTVWHHFYPKCIPCPEHAICLHPKQYPQCHNHYTLKPHPLSFDGRLPIAPICVLNWTPELQSIHVADFAERILRMRAGEEDCKTFRIIPKSSPDLMLRQQMSSQELKNEIMRHKDPGISNTQFEQYWSMALNELYSRSDKIDFERRDAQDWLWGDVYLRSLRPIRPLSCRARQSVQRWAIDSQPIIIAAVISAIAIILARHVYKKRKREADLVKLVAQKVLAKLSDQAHFHSTNPVLFQEPFLPQIHLRDAFLDDVYSTMERNLIWDKIRAAVEQNSNIRAGAQDVHGEPHRVWEWVGLPGVFNQKSE
ncbi:inner nuclear membrane protein enriched at telomere/subtelomere region [Podila verticillata]|nr:inner nuclear membrane protein enriched at telomere/subtelomere region [Podila verticillata]